MPVQRIYVVKRAPHDVEASGLIRSLKQELNIENIDSLKVLNRYDIECNNLDILKPTLDTVFAERMVDDLYIEDYPFEATDKFFAVEYLPGQFDQRSDSAEQCVKVMTGSDDVIVRSAKVYVFSGNVTDADIEAIKSYLINTIDSRSASMEKPATLAMAVPEVLPVPNIEGFIKMNDNELVELIGKMGLAMSIEDIKFSQDYFKNEDRNPTETELRLLDTYWSDHCRHTTFHTEITGIEVEDGKYKDLFNESIENVKNIRTTLERNHKPLTLMEMATIGARYAKHNGLLTNEEVSEENNACSIDIIVNTKDGEYEKWLLQFKNETHNHPTEIEPFGGAATCLGGAIRDPLSGRAYVYQSMRITGGSDPRRPLSETMRGKLSQHKITKEAAKGFSSYGNQIGLATGYVQEYYHEGFLAKRMEAGAVIAAVPKENVTRLSPAKGDKIILIGGKTGRDGVGGATGSSKEHDVASIELCGAEVQKGNAPEEHKIQRLFRKPKVAKLIKKCNDFGAGGVGVAIGELADGLYVKLDKVPKKYSGLTGTEIAISESQERMAAVLAPEHVVEFLNHCSFENLEATVVAEVTDSDRLQMEHDGRLIVDLSREFLDSAGAKRSQAITVNNIENDDFFSNKTEATLKETAINILSDLNVCSQKGMVELFDSTIGASSVLTPFGGITANTPTESMTCKIPVVDKDTTTVSIMASGYNPHLSSKSMYHGAMYAVVESVSKVIAAGGKIDDVRLSFQEYFERLSTDEKRWGKPFASLLGSIDAQVKLGLGAIGGKDSMSGTFKDSTSGEEINVPPTLISFAVAPSDLVFSRSPEFKKGEGDLYFVKTRIDEHGILDFEQYIKNITYIRGLFALDKIAAIYTVKNGGIVEAISKMAFGNMVGFELDEELTLDELTRQHYGSFVIQVKKDITISYPKIGSIIAAPMFVYKNERIALEELLEAWQTPLEKVFPTSTGDTGIIEANDYTGAKIITKSQHTVKPNVAILALPGTNCEYDTRRIFRQAGANEYEPFIFRNMNARMAEESCEYFAKVIRNSQILAIPGGFSAGDEPEGSGKFYVSVFKNKHIRNAIEDLLVNRDGLIIGICNGFQALLKTGLLTHGHIADLTEDDATLTFNKIGRHVSQMVRTRVASTKSPWLSLRNVGDIDIVPVSHGEGRFTAPEHVLKQLFDNGQVAMQYCDIKGNITMESPFNPNGSDLAIEAICSPDGRVLGRMGHSERYGYGVHMNSAYANMDSKIFEAGVRYFTGEDLKNDIDTEK